MIVYDMLYYQLCYILKLCCFATVTQCKKSPFHLLVGYYSENWWKSISYVGLQSHKWVVLFKRP